MHGETVKFTDMLSERILRYQNGMKILPVWADLFHADGRMGTQTWRR